MSKNTQQSNVRSVPLEIVAFMDAFCRRDLTIDEINLIVDMFESITGSSRLSDPYTKLRTFLGTSPQIVTGSASNLNVFRTQRTANLPREGQ